MVLLTPVAPTITTPTTTGYTITVNSDGNPGGTFYSFLTVGPTTKYVNALGVLQDTQVWLNVASITVTGAASNTFYSVSLTAASDALGTNESAVGPSASVTTLAAVPTASVFTSVFSSIVTANWLANGNPSGTMYEVQLTTDPSFVSGIITSGFFNALAYQFANLLPSTTYYARVKAKNGVGIQTSFASLSSTTTAAGPDTVKAIRVTNMLAERGFWIQWRPNLETNLTSYRVYRSSSPTDSSSYAQVGVTPPNVTTFIDNVSFTFGIVYYYKVTAVDAGGNESPLYLTTPAQDNSFHSFEEQPFPNTISQGDIVEDEIPSGLINTSNVLYTTAFGYRKGSLTVFLNGVKMMHTIDFVEGPLSQQFTMTDPPDTGGFLRVSYLKF